jgi:ribulose-5-phosphate 4-epimerase/fuculose-1-phosphate aldolase
MIVEHEGYIKFNCEWQKTAPLPVDELEALIRWRDTLYRYGFIGAYPNGIGFGNISKRHKGEKFIISGSGTGNHQVIFPDHFSLVDSFDIERNYLKCMGPVKASSESLTHGTIYREAPEVNAIIHIHHMGFWKKLLSIVPSTSKNATYGTPDMAREIVRVFQNTDVRRQKILVMKGHEEGIIAFGKDLDDAAEVLLEFAHRLDIIA